MLSLNALLLEDGFELNETDNSGATPLIWSAFCGSEITLTYLLAQPGIEVNAQNDKGETALHLAIQAPHSVKPANIIKRLMIKGASLDIKDSKGRKPIEVCKKRIEKNPKLRDALGCLERADEGKKSCW